MFDSYRDLFINSNSLRYKALREDFDLSSPMKAGRALELSKIQAKELENLHQTVNAVKCNRKELQHISKGNSAINKIAKSHALATSHTIAATPEKKMVNVGTAVDHTLTKTHALRKTRSANPVAN